MKLVKVLFSLDDSLPQAVKFINRPSLPDVTKILARGYSQLLPLPNRSLNADDREFLLIRESSRGKSLYSCAFALLLRHVTQLLETRVFEVCRGPPRNTTPELLVKIRNEKKKVHRTR